MELIFFICVICASVAGAEGATTTICLDNSRTLTQPDFRFAIPDLRFTRVVVNRKLTIGNRHPFFYAIPRVIFAFMIEIGTTLVSDDLVEKQFVCDLNACKGACCIHGDSGAPLEDGEEVLLEEIYPIVEPYLTEKGKKAIKKQGKWLIDSDGDKVTPLVGGNKECAYTIFENDTAFCGIEKAFRDGKVKWQKPVSCHLYPVRITEHKKFTAVNYEKWDICKPACACGEKLQVPVYKFVKTALVRKFGKEWYKQLELAADFMSKSGEKRR